MSLRGQALIIDLVSSDEESDFIESEPSPTVQIDDESKSDVSDVDEETKSDNDSAVPPRPHGPGAVDVDDSNRDQVDVSTGGAPSTAGPRSMRIPRHPDGRLVHEALDPRIPTVQSPLTIQQFEYQTTQTPSYIQLVGEFDIDGVTIDGPVEIVKHLAGVHMEVWGGPSRLMDASGKREGMTKVSSCGSASYYIPDGLRSPFIETLNDHFGIQLLCRPERRNLLMEARTMTRWDFVQALTTIQCPRVLYQVYGEKSSVDDYSECLTSLKTNVPSALITVDFSRHVGYDRELDVPPYQTVVDTVITNKPGFSTMRKVLFRDFSLAQMMQLHPLLFKIEDCYGTVVFTKTKESTHWPWLDKVKVYNKSVHYLKSKRSVKWSWIPKGLKSLKPFQKHFEDAIYVYDENKTSDSMKWSRVELTMEWVDLATATSRFKTVFKSLKKIMIARHIDMDVSITCMENLYRGLRRDKRLFSGQWGHLLNETQRREFAWMVDTIGTGSHAIQELVRKSYIDLGIHLFVDYILDEQSQSSRSESESDVQRSSSNGSDYDESPERVLSDEALRIYQQVRMNPTAQGKFRAHYKSGGQCMARETRIELAQGLEAKGIDWANKLILYPVDMVTI
ncbi:hypothetical protein DYB37_003976 [Aphanomyces astaci]|uniref:Uncharacterized protein n=3 Tax=Aphanomyces astaci TaxID=112090 RepID=A0A397FI97_APHAT|nr:hypothetical protein DYB31_009340 [Aphanomyces astaci]RHZ31436.1 hypothetical protein DYB37_003976 [Aphanomyces astaci]